VCEETAPVVLEVREAGTSALDLLDEQDHRRRRSIAAAGAVMVQDLGSRATKGSTEAPQLGNFRCCALFERDVARRVPSTEKARRVLGFEATTSLDSTPSA
jgi:hypothetical protein